MRYVAVVLTLAASVAWPATAGAGGFATVGLDPLPASLPAGEPWTVELTILQHGRTPLDGVEPTVWITRGEREAFFEASPTGRPGVYRTTVRFPDPGRWDVEVDDGFVPGMPRHGFRPVEVTAPASSHAAVRAGATARAFVAALLQVTP